MGRDMAIPRGPVCCRVLVNGAPETGRLCDIIPPNSHSNLVSWVLLYPHVALGKLRPGEDAGLGEQGCKEQAGAFCPHAGVWDQLAGTNGPCCPTRRARGHQPALTCPTHSVGGMRVGYPIPEGSSCKCLQPQRNQLSAPGRFSV